MRKITFFSSLFLLFMIPWEGVIYLPGLGTATKLIGFAMAGLWFYTVVFTGRFRKPNAFHITAGIFVLWNAISIFWTPNVNRSFRHVMTWTQLFAMAYIIWDLYLTRERLVAGLQAYIFGAYVVIGSSIANFLSGTTSYYVRYSADGTNTNDMGAILTLGIPIAIYLATLKIEGRMGTVMKIFNIIYLPATIVGIALSGSRTALLSSIPGVVFGLIVLFRLRLSSQILILAVFTTAALIILPNIQNLPSVERIGTVFEELKAGELNQRTYLWKEGLDSFAERPLIGVGSNMYRSANSLGKVAHNSFISVLVELGLIGFIVFSTMLGIVVFRTMSHPKWSRRLWLAVLASWTVSVSTLTWEFRKPTWFVLSMIIASASLVRKGEIPEPEFESQVSEDQAFSAPINEPIFTR